MDLLWNFGLVLWVFFLVNYLGQKVALQGDAMTDVCAAILTVHDLRVVFQLLQT